MATPNAQFEHELEVFRTEEEKATQFFYAYLAVSAVAADNDAVHRLLNQAPLFWNTCLYRALRNKIFAHKEVSDQGAAAALWGKTNIRELELMFVFLRSLYGALWQLFFNGRKPVLRRSRYSVARMRE